MYKVVNMPIICVGEGCRDCNNIEIDKSPDITLGYDGKFPFTNNVYYCKHYRRCDAILENRRKNSNADNEKEGV